MLRLAALFLLFAQGAVAACTGTDLRATLSTQERAALAQALQGIPYPEGNRWRAERDGQVIYLIGTMHLDDPRMAAPLARLAPLVQGAGKVLLETDATGEAALKRQLATSPERLILPDSSLPELMSDEDWTRLAQAVQARGLPPFMAARFQPWYLTMMLALPPCLMRGGAIAPGLDKAIADIARSAQVPTGSLEPSDTVFALFGDIALEAQVQMLLASLVPDGQAEDMLATTAASYFQERHAESWAIGLILQNRQTPGGDAALKQLQQTLLDDRNRRWIPVLLDNLPHQPLVAAFGAAHLFGDAGVLRLLEAEGFTLTREAF